MTPSITLSSEHLGALREHLFVGQDEQAAFGFANWVAPTATFEIIAIELVPPAGFAFQAGYHIELGAETQARVIKRAFDLGATIVEFHSHRSSWPAAFSWSDFRGFEEFVPHVRWRLAGRPYGAVVFHETSIDGLAWIDQAPVSVGHILPQGQDPHETTGLSIKALEEGYDR
jgi:hypothetical protein